MEYQVNKEVVNIILDTIRDNQISMKEFDEAIAVIKNAYYSDAVIK